MARSDSQDRIRRAVREELKRALAPHLSSIARIESAFSALATALSRVHRPSKRSSHASRSPPAHERYRKLKTPTERGDPTRFSIGERVELRVGRGTYEGVVTRLEPSTGSVFVRRMLQGDVQKRPANTVVPLAKPKGAQRASKGSARKRIRN